ncbi:SWIM zinc finger family protein, partial [Streptomyces sp. DSM 44917]
MSPPDRAPDSWSARLAERLASFGYALGPVRRALPVRGPLIGSGSVRAQVRGMGGHWHEVWIDLPVFTPQQWRRAEESLAPDLAEGRLPSTPAALDAAFARTGLSLLPATARDLTLECSCPDRSTPCAHLTAVLLAVADEFDADPFTLLALRGRDRDRLLTHSPAPAPPSPAPAAEL